MSSADLCCRRHVHLNLCWTVGDVFSVNTHVYRSQVCPVMVKHLVVVLHEAGSYLLPQRLVPHPDSPCNAHWQRERALDKNRCLLVHFNDTFVTVMRSHFWTFCLCCLSFHGDTQHLENSQTFDMKSTLRWPLMLQWLASFADVWWYSVVSSHIYDSEDVFFFLFHLFVSHFLS